MLCWGILPDYLGYSVRLPLDRLRIQGGWLCLVCVMFLMVLWLCRRGMVVRGLRWVCWLFRGLCWVVCWVVVDSLVIGVF